MVDWGGALSSGAAGGIAGATIGGPWGAAIGGLIGGAGGLFGGRRRRKKRSSLDKNQRLINDQQFQALQGQGPMADLYNYDPDMANQVFDQNISRPAYRNFQENLVPSITGQFRNNGLMNSSYAGDALARIARDVQEGLDAQRSQYLYGQQQDSMNARRNAMENFQNRQNFAYDVGAQQGGFNIDTVLNSITPKTVDYFESYFGNKKPTPPVTGV